MFNMLKNKSDMEMLKRIVCGMLYLLWDRKIYFPPKKISNFGVDFSYLQSFFPTTIMP